MLGGAVGGSPVALAVRLPAVAAVLALLSALACATLNVQTDYDVDADFTNLRTFAWLDPPIVEDRPPPADTDPFAYNSLLDKRVRAAVTANLEARDFEPAASDAADFLLRYYVVFRDRVRSSPYYGGAYVSGPYGPYWGPYGYYAGTTSYTYSEGTLVIDVIDPKTHQIIWRGWAESPNYDGSFDAEEVDGAVSAVMARFPPPPRPLEPVSPER
jgi:Domain of unknown function (DUF4136)